jgi:D-alanine-D-alanine ligase
MKVVGIICGGRSAEHEVSLQSAKNILKALPADKYQPVLLGIDKQGNWRLYDVYHAFLNADNPKKISLSDNGVNIALSQGGEIIDLANGKKINKLDVAFPIVHGTDGEDGTLQGLLKLLDIPFVGPSVLSSAVCMDKDFAKKIMQANQLPVSPYQVVFSATEALKNFDQYIKEFGLPFFVKPSAQGSSVGISKVKDHNDFVAAIKDAFQFDSKVLIEKYIQGREIECAVLGNQDPKVSLPGEIVPQHDFYSYEAKYLDDQGAILVAPAQLNEEQITQVQLLAKQTFLALGCRGMARVDFFMTDNNFYINEINTIPGFTKISMYPRLWQISGVSYNDLIHELIKLALDNYKEQKKLKTSYV